MAPIVAGTIATVVASACGPKKAEGPPVGVSVKDGTSTPPSDRPVVYAFDPVDDDKPVDSASQRGRPAVIAFITTGDIVCQAQVGFLKAMAGNDGDHVAYALVAVHPRREIVLVESYRATLGVDFPVALADGADMGESGPFGEIPGVPTVVVLDRLGRLAWKHTGLAKADEIRAHLRPLQ